MVTSDSVHPNTLTILIPSYKPIMLNWRCAKVNVLCHVTLSCKPEQWHRYYNNSKMDVHCARGSRLELFTPISPHGGPSFNCAPTQLIAYCRGAPSDQFIHIEYGGSLRSVSSQRIWGPPQISFFT